MFYNPYAAVPSLHAGFAVALGIAVALSARSQLLRLAGLVWGPLVIAVHLRHRKPLRRGRHGGVAITAVGFGVALLIERGLRPALRRRAALRRAAVAAVAAPAPAPPAPSPLAPAPSRAPVAAVGRARASPRA